jgi:hypothetical protein
MELRMMCIDEFKNSFATVGFVGVALLVLSGCSINVKKQPNGQNQRVEIDTPVGGIHVSEQANAADVGLAVYPGARLKPKNSDGNDESANVNISGFGFGIKVVALQYESDDAPAKILSFYKDQMKKYGSVLECHTTGLNLDMKMGEIDSDDNSHQLSCPKVDRSSSNNIELKVGKKDDQRIVSIKPQGKGSSFALVLVRTHGKQADI